MKRNSFFKVQIDKHSDLSFHQSAFIHSGKNVSFGELKRAIIDLSVVYKKNQLSGLSPVLVHLPMGIELAIVISSLLYEEIPALVLPTGMKSAEIIKMMKQYPFSGLLTNELLLENLLPGVAPLNVSKTKMGEVSLVSLRGPSEKPPGFDWLLYTSGSTGQPKMVMISAENLETRTLGEVELFGLKKNGHLLNLLPFSHDLGLNQLLTSLYTGSSLEILVNKLPMELAQKVSEGNFDSVTGMPQIWNNFIQIINKTNLNVNFSGVITISGGSMSEENLKKLRQIFGSAKIYKTYGQTETFRTFAEDRQDKIQRNQCGKVISGVGALILSENGNHCKEGEIGELFHYGHGVMNGYWMDESLTQSKLKQIEGHTGVLTGDYFKMLPEGELQYAGRKDDMIKHTGRRFFLGEIEQCLMRSDLIQEACVVQVNDDRIFLGNEKLVAFIITDLIASDLTKELKQYCAKNLENFKVPDEFFICKTFPLTASHKIDRKELLKIYYGK